MEELSKLKPREQGKLARLDGLPNHVNPYLQGSHEWSEWLRGWCYVHMKASYLGANPIEADEP